MIVQARGIVLRKTPYTSSSIILKVYTREFGIASFMVRGIGKRSRKSIITQPLTRITFATRESQKQSVNTLSDPELVNPGNNTYSNPLKSTIAIFLAEVLSKILREESADKELFDFVDTSLDYFEHSSSFLNFHLKFLLKLTSLLGFSVKNNYTEKMCFFDLEDGCFVGNQNSGIHVLTRQRSEKFYLLKCDEAYGAELHLGNRGRRELMEDILTYYSLHLDSMGNIKSLPVLQELFS